MQTSTAGTSERGFTLLETLVALAVGALVLSALYGALVRAAAARARAADGAARVTLARTLLLRIAAEMEGVLAAHAPDSPERFVVVAPPEDGGASRVRFARLGTDDLDLIAYRLEPEGPGRGVLVRRTASRFAPPGAAEPPGLPALAGVRLFRVRCFDGAEWRSAWTAPTLPRAVELALGVDDGAGGIEELTTTVVPAMGGT